MQLGSIWYAPGTSWKSCWKSRNIVFYITLCRVRTTGNDTKTPNADTEVNFAFFWATGTQPHSRLLHSRCLHWPLSTFLQFLFQFFLSPLQFFNLSLVLVQPIFQWMNERTGQQFHRLTQGFAEHCKRTHKAINVRKPENVVLVLSAIRQNQWASSKQEAAKLKNEETKQLWLTGQWCTWKHSCA